MIVSDIDIYISVIVVCALNLQPHRSQMSTCTKLVIGWLTRHESFLLAAGDVPQMSAVFPRQIYICVYRKAIFLAFEYWIGFFML